MNRKRPITAADPIVALNVPAELLSRIKTLAAARDTSPHEVIRELLRTALPLEPVLEGVLEQLQASTGRGRAGLISAIVIRFIAEALARGQAFPNVPLVLDCLAVRGGLPLEGAELFEFLHQRYVQFLQGQPPTADPRVQLPVLQQATQAMVQLAPQLAAQEEALHEQS